MEIREIARKFESSIASESDVIQNVVNKNFPLINSRINSINHE